MMTFEQEDRSPSNSHQEEELLKSTQKELDSHHENNIQLHPGHVLLLTSIPFFAGAVIGYKIPMESVVVSPSTPSNAGINCGATAATKSDVTNSSRVISKPHLASGTALSTASSSPCVHHRVVEEMTQDEAVALASRMAVRAFRITSLGMVATFSMVGAVGFYVSGYHSVDEAVQGTRSWASSWYRSVKHSFGTNERLYPDVEAATGIPEDEQTPRKT
jgi:hypothetical protein